MEFAINGVAYRTARLSVFEQLKVARKLLPLLASMVADFRTGQEKIGNHDSEGAVAAVLPKIASAVSSLNDDDVNAILFPCLSVVSREHMRGWVPVFQHGELAFDDIELLTLLQLVARVVADSLGNFLQGLPMDEKSAQPGE
ncbi:hypothetical protein EV102420_34_00310 [Pseudescherichia vulneris NBRC 102420]|uniref:Bacteriophage protein n=1 Tax=Pseudescherichia vulneris NBRC 102420 TaxID=1115515 RepID=A0A090VAD2_PSEVU|nr:hypothetical protein [Pseudescherichia vulneris]GAL60294.1 hypothetical protein EV102420_34_00310 [Pseudescherichia vulneris NBRC 102420]STQ61099.1 putative phage related protein [Pseudescherichia vulneris]